MKLALIQTNPTIGDVEGNADKVLARLDQAAGGGAQLAIFPEQTLIGYPAKDLLLRGDVIGRNVAALERIAAATTGPIAALVGYAEPNTGGYGRPVYNTAALLTQGRIVASSRKRLLPTYDIFDEVRYFEPGGPQSPAPLGERRLGVTICEDMWNQEALQAKPLYQCDPIGDLVAQGADLVINISASPFVHRKHAGRIALIAQHARRHRVPIVYVNQVGGNDELLFDGASCVIDADGKVVAQAKSFAEDLLIVDLQQPESARREPLLEGAAELHAALVMGLRDYVRKCRFKSVVLGLSGGIDSAVTAVIAVDALGPDKVHGVAMPSRYSSDHSVTDARALAESLRIRFSLVEIEPMHAAYETALRPHFAGRDSAVAEENVQARARGAILMAFSNACGDLLLTTGNKSELAVGYCTLYGDMCGGLAVLSDVPKTKVYELAKHINAAAGREVIPASTIEKPPSAELKPDQTDQDSLPPYEVLDAILERYEERLESVEQIVAAGFDEAVVRDVVRKIQANEYKRQQAAPGLKVTSRAFGFGRRMPIAARM